MNRQVSLVEIFDLLKSGVPPEKIKAQFPSLEPDVVDNIVQSMANLDGLLEKAKTHPAPPETTELSAKARRAFCSWLSADKQVTPDAGQVWSVEVPGALQLYLAAILDVCDSASDDLLAIAPISTDIEFAAEDDLVLSSDESPVAYEFMIEAWNYGTVARDCLREYQGILNDQLLSYLLALYTHCVTDEPLESVCSREGISCDELRMHTGSVLEDQDDPRVYFRRREHSTYRDLWKAGLAVMTAQDKPSVQAIAEEQSPWEAVGPVSSLWTILLSKVERPTLGQWRMPSTLAAASEDQRRRSYYEGEHEGSHVVAWLRYNRLRRQLDLYFADAAQQLVGKQATLEAYLEGHQRCIAKDLSISISDEEPVELGDVKETDIAELRLVVKG